MKKIFDSSTYKIQEDLSNYLDPAKIVFHEWGEPPLENELIELFQQWPLGTSLYDVFPHCKPCFVYPVLEDNLFIYRKLTRSREYKGLFDPLDFFNLLYEKFKFVLDNVHSDPDQVIRRLVKTNLVKRKLHFFLYSLHLIISGVNGPVTADRMWPDGITTLKNKKLGHLDLGIIDAYQSLDKELGLETENTDIPNYKLWNKENETEESEKDLTMNQIALLYFYKGININETNGAEIAEKHGFCSKTSGHKLYQLYNDFSSRANRMAYPDTRKTFENKIALFESIFNLITDTDRYKSLLIDELKLLSSTFKIRYPEK